MKTLKKLLSIIICCFMCFLCACANIDDHEDEEIKKFIGFAVYQESSENTNWNDISKYPENINLHIKTKTEYLTCDDKYLFYAYNKNIDFENDTNNKFHTNTTMSYDKSEHEISLEINSETSQVIVYYVYLTVNDNYKLIKVSNITVGETQSLNYNINKTQVVLTLSKNLTTS